MSKILVELTVDDRYEERLRGLLTNIQHDHEECSCVPTQFLHCSMLNYIEERLNAFLSFSRMVAIYPEGRSGPVTSSRVVEVVLDA